MPHSLTAQGPNARNFVGIAVIEERLVSDEIGHLLNHCLVDGRVVIDD
jgi:hypothetical protein